MIKLEQKLSRVDLNLLVSLSVLLKEQSVTKAAEALFVSQPAMSKTLQRLRELFDDPLFYRTPAGMKPTEKAKEIEKQLPVILPMIESLLKKEDFDPATCKQTFSISIPSVLGHSMLLPFLTRIKSIAPNICLIDLPSDADPVASLEQDKYDFAIHVVKPKNQQINCTPLGQIQPHVYARKSHPLARSKRTKQLKDLAEYKFIDYQVGSNEIKNFENPAEKIVRLLNFEPDIVFKSSHLSLLTDLLSHNDYLFISPGLMMNSPNFSDKFISVFEFEIPKDERYEIVLLESPYNKHNTAQQWLKNELVKSITLS